MKSCSGIFDKTAEMVASIFGYEELYIDYVYACTYIDYIQ